MFLFSEFSTCNEENIYRKWKGWLLGNSPVTETFTFIDFDNCYKLNCVRHARKNNYIAVLTPSTSECVLIWK